MVKKDLVQVLIDHYRSRIQPSLPSEVTDIAEDQNVTPREVCSAMLIAMDELELQAKWNHEDYGKEIARALQEQAAKRKA